MSRDEIIESAARVLSTLTTCDGQPHATGLHYRQARALADAGLLARPLPTRDEIKKFLQLEFGSFLAHSPANPERFWGSAVDEMIYLLKETNK